MLLWKNFHAGLHIWKTILGSDIRLRHQSVIWRRNIYELDESLMFFDWGAGGGRWGTSNSKLSFRRHFLQAAKIKTYLGFQFSRKVFVTQIKNCKVFLPASCFPQMVVKFSPSPNSISILDCQKNPKTMPCLGGMCTASTQIRHYVP